MRFMLLSVATALATMLLKASAAWITGSVGLLSDALESGVNLVAALVGLAALRLAAKPADANHDFGHGKAEYLSAAVEGTMVFAAATVILWTSVERLISPQPVTEVGLGLVLSAGSSALNLVVGLLLIRQGRAHRSITLVADGKHLLTDVWTSAGVLVGVALVALSGWDVLDPIVAILVALNILRIGFGLVRQAVVGMLDAVLPPEDVTAVNAVLDRYREPGVVTILPPRTRESGRQRFVYLVVRVPGDWTVRAGHDLLDRIEADLGEALPGVAVFSHLEPDRAPTGRR
ncbi:cation diffusion facilitator family transporter [Rhodococcus rhodochrous]|uniref:cation diffusion facilitator family transporter n=1 Tax=Rhodococcus rhodochrous TaxID=1829 RepID=UPI001E2EA17C|nr:cation diffusion facilitator family transporter [Rhodococcus rhodochrous]MCD2098914.1 cation diffusion facilitator family transporter [Rhodococcus rhodochrous]MCD2123500.1 cation diffusion facilitator family transporter [Rhodococcus rhodochrous]MCQ4135085.1 cation diffusion facilitator family transporter [Rhodococcus rhodochrous]MDJ0020180.1 cation diffusion facilitator family transporter [Rhodococcus rhodochrous]